MLLYHDMMLGGSMAAPRTERPNKDLEGAFQTRGMKAFSVIVAPNSKSLSSYTIEVAHWPRTTHIPESMQHWNWASSRREVVTLEPTANKADARRLGTRAYRFEVPAGHVASYVRISDLVGGSVQIAVWGET